MGFKDQILQDLDTVFLNTDEFAEIHRIEGKEIAVVIDKDGLNKLKTGQILGLVEADMLVMGKTADLPIELEPGQALNIDGRELIVVDSGENMGLTEIALRQNRMG